MTPIIGDIPSQGSERLAIWLLVTITSSLLGERVADSPLAFELWVV
jgi:hypothetical protein